MRSSNRTGGKPAADWDDPDARAALVDALARDGQAVLAALEGEPLPPALAEAVTLLATVLGQDLEDGEDGRIRIARRVARDRVISTVDPETRHGHKTDARSFDGYKGHVALDPDAELVTATAVMPGNAGDASVALALLADELAAPDTTTTVYGDAASGEDAPVITGAELWKHCLRSGVTAVRGLQPLIELARLEVLPLGRSLRTARRIEAGNG